ncbi:hypothetical protein Vretimale_17448 [Volvox reticuliferus]|nr:hypothetical protein Vretifemale_9434 [Volvox reticuliferus]GIM14532.1 hypothetical protein Vretimale_17448 [Volvox reticuliferus]
MEYTLTLPYLKTMQPEGLRYPVHVWWDGPGQRYRFDSYGGIDSTGWNLQEGYHWTVYPRITDMECDLTNGTAGPTLQKKLMALLGLGSGFSPLPDISGWSYAGTAQFRNSEAQVWQLSVRKQEKTANYQFYTAHNGQPLRFYMMGYNLITGGHFDEYLIEFTRFTAGPLDASVFDLPEVCTKEGTKHGQQSSRLQQQQQRGQPAEEGSEEEEEREVANSESDAVDNMVAAAARLGMLLPAAHVEAAAAQDTSAILNELRTRSETVLEANARFVDEHNRRVRNAAASATSAAGGGATANGAASALEAGISYSLSLNHFAHLTHEQWTASMLGLKRTTVSGAGSSSNNSNIKYGNDDDAADISLEAAGAAATDMYERVLADDQLPANVDWRGTGADGPGVKDQACCGSCWAFAAAGAMQAAWFKTTGQSLSFSEQQLVDCAWDYGNSGCGGGDVVPAFRYLLRVGGAAAQEADYPYMGQNGFCRVPFIPPRDRPDATTMTSASTNSTSTTSTTPAAASSSSLFGAPPIARFSGFKRVPSRNEKALMEAVALHGPVAVGIDGGRATFRFYSEGVYHNPHCGQKLEALDHAVLLVGYGTTPEGVDYWLIKNSWSKYWGMDGYARITRKGNDCGVSTDAVLALASEVPAPDDNGGPQVKAAMTSTRVT